LQSRSQRPLRAIRGVHAEQHLAGYAGLMQADAFAGFNRLYRASRKPGPIVEAMCWAHARRKFFDLARISKAPIALEAVERIDALFAIECEINVKPPQERQRVRNERSRPLVTALEAWLREQRGKLSGKSATAKAIAYSLTRWTELIRFLDDGRLCISNNAAERALRGIALGRHNWTFAGSDEGGRRAAAIYTLMRRPSSTRSTRRPGSPMSSHGCRIIRRTGSTNCCLGTENASASKRRLRNPPADHIHWYAVNRHFLPRMRTRNQKRRWRTFFLVQTNGVAFSL
jgi:transposase